MAYRMMNHSKNYYSTMGEHRAGVTNIDGYHMRVSLG